MDKYKWNYPTTMWVGKNSIYDLGLACKNLNITKPLLVTDTNFSKSEIIKDSLQRLKRDHFSVELFSNVIGNPTGSNVSDGVEFLKKKVRWCYCFWWGKCPRCWKSNSFYVRSIIIFMGL